MGIAGRPEVIDIFFLVILLRIIYIAASRGFLREFCKLAGLFCASFLAFGFYPYLSEIVRTRVSFINPNFLHFIAFFLIFVVVRLTFSLVILIIGLFLPKPEASAKDKVLLLGLGSFRAVFFLSVIFFSLSLLSFNPRYIRDSLTYNLFKKVAPSVYLFSAGIVRRLNEDFEVNTRVEGYLREDKPVKKGPVSI